MPEFEATASKSPSQRLVTAKQLTHFHLDSSAWQRLFTEQVKTAGRTLNGLRSSLS